MSFDAMSWAVKQQCKTPTSKLILLLIANYADENNSAYPSKDHLSRLANCDERTIRRSLRSLQDQGLLNVEERYDHKGRQTSNRYFLVLDKMSTERKDQTREGDIFEGVGVTKMPPNTIRKIQNKKYCSDFIEWWDAYPRKDGSKSKAYELWIKATKEVPVSHLLKITKMFSDSRKGEDQKFTPHATTWLNQKRYETVTAPQVKAKNLNSLAG